jgi:hypothetical protein
MTSLALKIEKYAVYIIIIYMATMTGLYFHMDSRISVLQTIQDKTLEKFTLKEQQHTDIDGKLSSDLKSLSTEVGTLSNNLTIKLNDITNLVLAHSLDNQRIVSPPKKPISSKDGR